MKKKAALLPYRRSCARSGSEAVSVGWIVVRGRSARSRSRPSSGSSTRHPAARCAAPRRDHGAALRDGHAGAGEEGRAGISPRRSCRRVRSTPSSFVLLTVVGIGTILAERATTTWSDTVMLARLQHRLHDRLLELGPSYHTQHASGETTTIVWRYANGAQMLPAIVVAFPVVRGVGPRPRFRSSSRTSPARRHAGGAEARLLGGVLITPIVSARAAPRASVPPPSRRCARATWRPTRLR